MVSCRGGSSPESPSSSSFSLILSLSTTNILNINEETTLSWSVEGNSNDVVCVASGDWGGAKYTNGSININTSNFGQYTYTLICSKGSLISSKSIDLYVSGLSEEIDFVSPESVGLDFQQLSDAFNYAMTDGNYTQSVIVVKDGKYVSEEYRGIKPSEKAVITSEGITSSYDTRDQFSLTTSWSTAKSFTSIIIGIAIDNGFIESIDTSASAYIYEWENDDRSKITIRNLLDMRSGLVPMCGQAGISDLFICTEPAGSGGALIWADNQLKSCIDRPLAQTGVSQPWFYSSIYTEDSFLYSNCDTNVLGEIIFRATGKNIKTYGDEVLFSKIGMDAFWWRDNSSGGQLNGNYLAYCCIDSTPIDFIKFGQLILNNGIWGRERIISEEYIQSVKNIIIDSKVEGGRFSYGLQFWTIRPTFHEDSVWYPSQNSLYATQGFDGQYIVIDFDNNMIIGRNSLYQPLLDLSPQRKMKLSTEGNNYTASLPSGSGLTIDSQFNLQRFLYEIKKAISN